MRFAAVTLLAWIALAANAKADRISYEVHGRVFSMYQSSPLPGYLTSLPFHGGTLSLGQTIRATLSFNTAAPATTPWPGAAEHTDFDTGAGRSGLSLTINGVTFGPSWLMQTTVADGHWDTVEVHNLSSDLGGEIALYLRDSSGTAFSGTRLPRALRRESFDPGAEGANITFQWQTYPADMYFATVRVDAIGPTASQAPEPSGLGLLALGGVALATTAWRRARTRPAHP